MIWVYLGSSHGKAYDHSQRRCFVLVQYTARLKPPIGKGSRFSFNFVM